MFFVELVLNIHITGDVLIYLTFKNFNNFNVKISFYSLVR